MPLSSHKKDKPNPQIEKLVAIGQQRNCFFLSPDRQTFVTIPGQAVPLWSEDFFRWYSSRLEHAGIFHPSPQQMAQALRKLDEDAHNCPEIVPVQLRSLQIAPNHYKFDIQGAFRETIEVTSKEWTIGDGEFCHYRQPETNLPLVRPKPAEAPLEAYLKRSFALTDPESESLKSWLTLAFLPTTTAPPILVITGKARDEATKILRDLIDPVVQPILPLQTTLNQFGNLAIYNHVLAFSLYGQLSKGRINALKSVRTGFAFTLKESNKRGVAITSTIRRPIIISSDEKQQISEQQLNLEINSVEDTNADEFLGALLSAAVMAIREFTKQPPRKFFAGGELAPSSQPQIPQVPEPDT